MSRLFVEAARSYSRLVLLFGFLGCCLSGCGKSLEKTARSSDLNQATAFSKNCRDSFQVEGKSVGGPSEVNTQGRYMLRRVIAMGEAVEGESTPNPARAVSVLRAEIHPGKNPVLQEVCHDLRESPESEYRWGIEIPSEIQIGDADSVRSRDLNETLKLFQTVFGPAVLTPEGHPKKPESSFLKEVGYTVSYSMQFFQIDASTIGVLSTIESIENGLREVSKSFARYSLQPAMGERRSGAQGRGAKGE